MSRSELKVSVYSSKGKSVVMRIEPLVVLAEDLE